jgi:hypothetical protein
MKAKAVTLVPIFLFSLVFSVLSYFSCSYPTPSTLLVDFNNDRLTVKAQNSMLIDILRQVCEKTGAVSVIKAKIE